MQATQWMNRTAQGPKWKPESAALRSRLIMHAHVYRSFVHSRRARGCHRGVKMGVKVWDKRRKAVGEDGKGVSSSCTDCSCKPAEKTVLVEIDTWTRKQNFKANETNNPYRSSKKSVVETDSKSSKIIDPGASKGDAPSEAKGRATT